MKQFLIWSVLLMSGIWANILFPVPYIDCKAGVDKCLRGQMCTRNNLCCYRRDKLSPKPCSRHGVCDPATIEIDSTSDDSACNGIRGSIYCGDQHNSEMCIPKKAGDPQFFRAGANIERMYSTFRRAAGLPTKDGSCGTQNGQTTCEGWVKGQCCSMYGWCGDSDSHCGNGCQSGPCISGGSTSAPGPLPAPVSNSGRFDIVGNSGVPAMHAGLLPNGNVFFLDKVEDKTLLKLPTGNYAYSSEYDPISQKTIPLGYKTNAFCSGGTYLANGDILAVGGNGPLKWLDDSVGDGFDGIRYLSRSAHDTSLNGQNWKEPGNKLASRRWYPSAQTLANGQVFVVSGSLNGLDPTEKKNNNPTYEILSATGIAISKTFKMDILEKNQPYFMYPFVHLLRNGNIFIFTAKSSQLFDIKRNKITKRLPDLPGDYRTYPNTGGSVLLPLSEKDEWKSRIMICGGGAYQDITSPTEPSCGVIAPEDKTPAWEMDSMPEGRGMVEGVLLPDGSVLWLNGCGRGAQGFELADNPTLRALIYNPAKPIGQRWTQLVASSIPRLYHSVALLLLDGTVLVAGSNPHEMPITSGKYPTEYRIEKFTPPYLTGQNGRLRPKNLKIPQNLEANGSAFMIEFSTTMTSKNLKISLYHGGFVTHSVHMGHRMMFLDYTGWNPGHAKQEINVYAPPNKNVAPPGDYVIYVVVDGVPSIGELIRIQ